jgi:hypothetical protein
MTCTCNSLVLFQGVFSKLEILLLRNALDAALEATPQAQAQQDERERMKQQVKHIKRARKRVIRQHSQFFQINAILVYIFAIAYMMVIFRKSP